jgi:hypothetical protein
MIKMKLSSKVIEILKHKDSLNLRNRLAYEMEKHGDTILRWINTNDAMLTTALALQIIREETGLSDDLILEQVSA